MKKEKFQVVILKRDGESICHNVQWSGENLDEGEIVAAHLFAKELIKYECLLKGELNTWCKNVNFEYVKKIKDVRIVLSKKFSFDEEVRKTALPTLKSYGDETVRYGTTIHLS